MKESDDTAAGCVATTFPGAAEPVHLPAGWTVECGNGLLTTVGPEDDLRIVFLTAPADAGLEATALAGWRRLDPEFDLAVVQLAEVPSTTGWDSAGQVVYRTPSAEGHFAMALVRVLNGRGYVNLVSGTKAAFSRRMAQLSEITEAWRPDGLTAPTLAGRPAADWNADFSRALSTFITQAMAELRTPGLSIAIVQGGRIVFAEGFGVTAAGNDVAVTPETLFRIGSTTKALTTLMMARLIAAGTLAWALSGQMHRPLGIDGYGPSMARPRKPQTPFYRFNSSPEIIRLVVMMYVKFPLSLRNVEDLLHERGIDLCHETVRFWWNRFGPMFAAEIRRRRVQAMRQHTHWRWHLDEVFVKINGEQHYLWRAVDHEGEVLESYVTRTRDKAAALAFIKKALKRHGSPEAITTDGLRSYKAAMKEIGNADKQEVGRWANNRVENSHQPFRRRERAMLRFRRMKSLQKFASVHASFHNHFNKDRHLTSRDSFKDQRSAALAEWQSLMA